MSIKRVICTSGQNVKPPFLRQYLIFFKNFLYIRDHISIITLTQKCKFEENCRSEGIRFKGAATSTRPQGFLCFQGGAILNLETTLGTRLRQPSDKRRSLCFLRDQRVVASCGAIFFFSARLLESKWKTDLWWRFELWIVLVWCTWLLAGSMVLLWYYLFRPFRRRLFYALY